MSKHYDEVWQLIETLDDINSQLSDMLDDERDRAAKPHLREATMQDTPLRRLIHQRRRSFLHSATF